MSDISTPRKIKNREKVTELLEEAWYLCICNTEKDLGVVVEHMVILNDQDASGLKKTNVILQHCGKQSPHQLSCNIDTSVSGCRKGWARIA